MNEINFEFNIIIQKCPESTGWIFIKQYTIKLHSTSNVRREHG